MVSRDYYSDGSSDGRLQETAEKASNPEEKNALEDVQVFLENKGLTEEATSVSLMVSTSTVAQLYCSSVAFKKQTTIDNYFDVQ